MINHLKKAVHHFSEKFRQKHGFGPMWLIRYAVGGTLTTIAEWSCYYILYKPFGVDYLVSSVAANILSYVVNYLLSKYYVFHSPETSHKRDLPLFVLCSGVNLVLMTLLVKLTVGVLSMHEMVGRIIANVIAFVAVFVFKRYIIWSDTKKY